MTPDLRVKLRESLIQDEEYKKFPYLDTQGKVTIGIGYNLTDRGISDQWIGEQFNEDVDYIYSKLTEVYTFFLGLTEERQIALINMCYNLGLKDFQEFHGMLDALNNGDYKLASQEMLNSKWAHEVGERAVRLANIMEGNE